jgi:hypothetical protein
MAARTPAITARTVPKFLAARDSVDEVLEEYLRCSGKMCWNAYDFLLS